VSDRIPRVSLGLPVRNGAPQVAAAIESLLAQDFGDFELLISDNASDDGTAELCSAFAQSDSRVRYERLPADVGALQNFERVLLRARAKYFMWAAHDDRRRPSCIRECLDALESAPEAVLAVTDVETIDPAGTRSRHSFPADVSSGDRRRRLRWILRGGGWAAIYGLIRVEALNRVRSLSDVARLPRWLRYPDYLVVELSVLGPFARVAAPLLICRVRLREKPRELAARLDSHWPLPYSDTTLLPMFRDLWRIGARHGLELSTRTALVTELLRSAAAPGTFHDVLLERNTEALRAVVARRGWSHLPRLLIERACLAPGSVATRP
jgi:glycosyltransferase involved in cell wall biosynthesis